MLDALRHAAGLGFAPAVVVDVGAADGTPDLLEAFPSARFLWIEPIAENEPALRELSRRYAGKYVLGAAGRAPGTAPIHVGANRDGSSLLDDGAGGERREIAVVRLDDLVEPSDLRGEVLLKINAQGTELDVLEGAPRLLESAEVVVIETSFFRFRSGFPDFFDVVSAMKARGWVAYDIVAGRNRPHDKALAHKYVVFVKESGRFRTTHRWG